MELTSNQKTVDRVSGVLLGLSAGDQIGGPTQMSLQLSESLSNNAGFIIDDVKKRYLKWWYADGFDTGSIAAEVFNLVNSGRTFEEAANTIHVESNEMTAGCNPVHRNVVLSTSQGILDSELRLAAIQETNITHIHYLAGEVSSAACLVARWLIKGISWEKALLKVKLKATVEIQKIILQGLERDIYPDGYSPHVLSAAIYFINSSKSFDEALQRSIDFAGEENFCPVLVGSLGGARWGSSSVSNYWLMGMRELDEINAIAEKLANDW